MHNKYAKDGFQVVSVTTDKTTETKALASAREFVRDRLKVPFPNAHVDMTTFDYEGKISTEGVPAVFIFNRDNKWAQKMPAFSADGKTITQEVDYDAIEKAVVELLKKK